MDTDLEVSSSNSATLLSSFSRFQMVCLPEAVMVATAVMPELTGLGVVMLASVEPDHDLQVYQEFGRVEPCAEQQHFQALFDVAIQNSREWDRLQSVYRK